MTFNILRPFIIILTCAFLGISTEAAQTSKSSGMQQSTATSQSRKASATKQKATGTQKNKPSGSSSQSSNKQSKKSASAGGKKSQGKQQNAPKPQSTQSLQNEQKTIKAEIAQTQRQIDENKQSTLKQLNSLDQLKGEILTTTNNINNLTQEVRSIEAQEKVAVDSIDRLDTKIDRLRLESAKTLRDSRKNRQSMSELSLVFSSKSFYQALKRSGRIRQANEKAVQRTDELKESIALLNEQKQKLAELRQLHSEKLTGLSAENANLLTKQQQTQSLVSDLKKQGSLLQQTLLEKQKRMKALDDEITRLIAEEKRRAEEARRKEEARLKEQQRKEEAKRTAENKDTSAPGADKKKSTSDKPLAGAAEATSALSGSFASNKGKLMFPVTGSYNIVSFFGRNQHEDLPNVEIDNSGIDILTQPGANARAVFDGVVSMIVNLGGSHNVVMVRHGEYITVYSNIKTASVKKGDSVKAGQNIGSVYTDAADNNRTILHFEVRKETQKLNPLQWVKR